ncbi:MAG TPA: SCO family protein [Candidatus Binatia bacterium]|nr:SCO family protein [Candidatus Binatia bacterium]
MRRFLPAVATAAAVLLSIATAHAADTAHLLVQPRALPDFKLTDQAGRTFTRASLSGHWTVLYNGRTQCAVVCPKALRFMDALQKRLGGEAPQLVLVTNAHGLDSPAELKDYVGSFNTGITGLTGRATEVERLQGALRDAGQIWESTDPALALINPQGELVGFVSAPLDARPQVMDVSALVSNSSGSLSRLAR